MEILIAIFQVIGIVLGILIGFFILELAIVALIPGFWTLEQRLERKKQTPNEVNEAPRHLRKGVSFKVKETALSAWLYLPEKMAPSFPCIIMAHGAGKKIIPLLEKEWHKFFINE